MEIKHPKHNWILKPQPEAKHIAQLANELSVSDVLAKLLIQKGVSTFEEAKLFFRPSLENLHNPFLMKDMQKAVDRIIQAIENKENILVYGDYDVDGTTSVAMMYSFLQQFTEHITYYIPDRYHEGYGVSTQGIQYAIDNEIKLIISLDCGIKSEDKVAMAAENGIDFIICDHHLPGETLPNAIAILDPKQADCNYPFDELSGCGVGFKLIQALCKTLDLPNEKYEEYLDFVAVSTAADIVPLTDENRILTYFGLRKLEENPAIGLKVLMQQHNENQAFTVSDIVFKIAPKINAAGRIHHAHLAVKLLISKNEDEAIELAKEIGILNSERKDLDSNVTQEALEQIIQNQEEKNKTTVVLGKNWHKGVLGIVASRLTDTYYRPTIVFTESKGLLVASARSVKNFSIYDALEACSPYLEQFGGHKYAAGLTMKMEHYEDFKNAFEQYVSQNITPSALVKSLEINTEIKLSEINDKFIRILKQFAPFGPKNMRPVFLATNVWDTGYGRTIGNEDNHLKINLFQEGTHETFPAVGFGLGEYFPYIQNRPFDIVFTIDENHWQGKTFLQLMIRDIKVPS